jgi:hypothetical protein
VRPHKPESTARSADRSIAMKVGRQTACHRWRGGHIDVASTDASNGARNRRQTDLLGVPLSGPFSWPFPGFGWSAGTQTQRALEAGFS